MALTFQAPIPGQSLTTEPGNAPWEQPPLYADNEKALAFHLDRLGKDEHVDDLLFLLDRGFPIETFVDSLTTSAVMKGVHSIDTSTLISPVIHEYVKKLASSANVKYREWAGPTDEEKQEEKFKQRLGIMISDPDTFRDNEEPVPAPVEEAPQGSGLIPRRK